MSSTKHCSVCAKAGMPEEVYSSHYVRESRDPHSRVTCPLIKYNKCGKCGKTGHFSSTCKVTERKPEPVKQIKVNKVQVANRFAFSDSDTDESDEPEKAGDSDKEPVKITKNQRHADAETILAEWQKEYAHILELPEEQRNTPHVYWNKTYGKIVKKKYEIFTSNEGVLVVRYRPSWASDSEDSDND
jgi:hypothetical protein